MDSPSPRRYYRHHHHSSNALLHQRHPTPTSPPFHRSNNLGRSEPGNPTPTTFVQADRNNFKHVVQMLTGCNDTTTTKHHIPPMKTIPNKKQQQHHHQSGFKLYERRNQNHLNLNPILPPPGTLSPRNHHNELLSPSILDFPSLVLSPVTPLIPDPFARSSSSIPILDKDAEDRAIKDKGFFPPPSFSGNHS